MKKVNIDFMEMERRMLYSRRTTKKNREKKISLKNEENNDVFISMQKHGKWVNPNFIKNA
jgi:hypothetical protein